MSTGRTHARNLLANWTGHGANLLVMFFLSPFIVHTLGKVEYGIWSLLTVLTGYMGVLDLGVRASTGRYIVFYLGREDAEAVDQTIRTSLGFFSGLGLFIVAVGTSVGWLFPALFRSVPDEYVLISQLLLPLLALNVWFSAIQGVFSSLLAAHDRFDLTRAVDLTVLALQTAGTVVVLVVGWGICGLAGVVVTCRMAGVVGNYLLARHIYIPLQVWPLQMKKARLRELFGYGLAAFVSMVAIRVIGQTGLVVAGAAIDVKAAAVFSVGAMLVFYSDTFLRHIALTLFPAIQRAVASERYGDARWLYLRAGRLNLIFGILIYGGVLVFAEPFIRLWMLGPEFGERSVREAASVMQLLAASKFGLLFVGASVSALNALGRVKLTAALAAAEAILNLSLSLIFVLTFGWGLVGIAGATLVARMLIGTFQAPWFACRSLGADWRTYLLRIGGSELLVGLLFAGWCLVIRQLGPIESWGMFFGQVALATAGYPPLAFWILVPAADRQRIWNRLFQWRDTLARALPRW